MTDRFFWVRSASPSRPEDPASGFSIRTLAFGYPGHMGTISVFTAFLREGRMPHEINSHREEEMMLVLSGELDAFADGETRRLARGNFVYVAPDHPHSVQCVGSESAEFLVLKWVDDSVSGSHSSTTSFVFDRDQLRSWNEEPVIQRHRVCECQPLANGGTLVADMVRIGPRGGYPVHTHEHDLVLVLLTGQMHAFGPPTSAPAVMYYPAGTPHGMAPLGSEPVEMIALEFHRAGLT